LNLARLRPTPSLLLLASAVLPLGCTHPQPAQQPATTTAPPPAVSQPALPEITFSDRCLVVAAERTPAPPSDSAICHLEGAHITQHTEESIRDGITHTQLVEVHERTYLLQNPYDYPVAFLIKQSLPPGFHPDSDPRPIATSDSIATFRVIAEPGQIVRIHVGEHGPAAPNSFPSVTMQ
jgi:hypothetical protein